MMNPNEQLQFEYEKLLKEAIADFCQRFDTWIMNQAETVKFSSALAFGEEYKRLREMVEKAQRGRVGV